MCDPKGYAFPLVLRKIDEPGRGTRAQIRQEACARYSPVENAAPGAAVLPDAVSLTQGEPHKEVKILLPGREEQWTVHPQAMETQPFPTIRELHHLDILDSSLFQGSGCCKDVLSLLGHLLVEAGKLSTSALPGPEKV